MDFHRHPFGVPLYVKFAEEINHIAKISYTTQQKLRMTNACFFACIILKRCLDAIDVEAQIVYGTLVTETIKLPHVWIQVDGHVIDNTNADNLSEAEHITLKQTSKYIKGVNNSGDLYLGDHVTQSKGIHDHSINQFNWFLENHDRALAMSKNKIQIKEYWDYMQMLMLRRFNAEIQEISDKAYNSCWACDKKAEVISTLKKCSVCKVALYCDKACQKTDWKKYHKEVCLVPDSY